MAKVSKFIDHKLLEYQAMQEGLDYRKYRRKLEFHNIPLEVAIENAWKGISIEEYEIQKRKTEKITKIVKLSFIVLLFGLSIYNGCNNNTIENKLEYFYEHYQ